MKLFSGSIFYCLLISSLCNAAQTESSQQTRMWSFPVATKVMNLLKHTPTPPQQQSLSQNPSCEWPAQETSIDIKELRKANTPSPDFVLITVDGQEEKKSPTPPLSNHSIQPTIQPHMHTHEEPSGIAYVDSMIAQSTVSQTSMVTRPNRLSQNVIDGSNIQLTEIFSKTQSQKKLAGNPLALSGQSAPKQKVQTPGQLPYDQHIEQLTLVTDVTAQPNPMHTVISYQNQGQEPFEINRDSLDQPDQSDDCDTSSILTILIAYCPCLDFTHRTQQDGKKKSSNQSNK